MDIACEFLQYDIWDQRVTNHCQTKLTKIDIYFNVGFSISSKAIELVSVQVHVS